MRDIYLNLLGINEQWTQKTITEPMLVILFENLSSKGLILLKNMLFAVDLIIDNERVQIKESFTTDLKQKRNKSQTIFLISDSTDITNSKKIFFCPHPNKIIENSTLKSESWRVMVALQKALNDVN